MRSKFTLGLCLVLSACGSNVSGGNGPDSSADSDQPADGDGDTADSLPPDTDHGDPAPSRPSITIDATRQYGKLPSIGYNMTYINNGQGLVGPSGTTNLTLRNALVDVGTDWLRYPGGTFANLFDWRRAIGSVEGRWGLNAFTMQPEQHVFGLDEAALLAEDMGGTLLCVVNINLGADVAADWVEYMNAAVGTNPNGGTAWANVRAANGHPAPYQVTQWELANESGNGRIWQVWDADDDFLAPSAEQVTASRPLIVEGGSRRFSNYQAVTRTTWAYDDDALRLTTGPNQVRYTKLAPVVAESFVVRVGTSASTSIAWTQVVDLTASSAEATHYALDAATGEIRFGDGAHGAIPPEGSFVFTDFTTSRLPGLRQFATAMKEVDASIEVSGSFPFLDRVVAEDPTLPLDGWQWHIVDNFPVPDYYPDDPHQNMLSRIALTQGLLLRTATAFDTSLRVFGTEVHPWQDAAAGGVNLRNTALGAMGIVASYALASAIDDKVAVLGPNYLTWTGLGSQSAVNPSTAVPNAEAWALKLFRDFTGARRAAYIAEPPLETRAVSAYADEAGSATLTADLSKLVVLPSVSDDGKSLMVLVINTTADETLSRTIVAGPPFDDIAVADVKTISAPTPTTMNTPANPRAVAITQQPLPPVDAEMSFPPTSVTAIRWQLP